MTIGPNNSMITLNVSLERKPKPGNDESVAQRLKEKAWFTANEKEKRLPSLNEVLYNMDEDKMLSMKDVLGDESNQ